MLQGYRDIQRAKAEYPLSVARIRAFPKPLLGMQVRGGLKGLMYLDDREGGQERWLSSNGVLLVLDAGRVVRSRGFASDVLGNVPLKWQDPLGSRLDPGKSYQFSRQLDLGPDRYGIVTEHRMDYLGKEALQVLDRPQSAAVWTETVRLPRLRLQWSNRYYLDPASGFVLRSTQHLDLDVELTLEYLSV